MGGSFASRQAASRQGWYGLHPGLRTTFDEVTWRNGYECAVINGADRSVRSVTGLSASAWMSLSEARRRRLKESDWRHGYEAAITEARATSPGQARGAAQSLVAN